MRFSIRLLAACAATALLAPASAGAATFPSVKKISPMKVAIGEVLTIRGKGFVAGKNRNTVVFQAKHGPAIFVKAAKATKTKLTLTVPDKLAGSFSQKNGALVPTRFRIRVLSKRFGRSFTATKSSPVIGPEGSGTTPPTDCDHDGTPNTTDLDDDNDLLTDDREAQLGTDPCNADTDGDGVSDYYEVESALDLNSRAIPYPGKRPFPNALDPTDSAVDYDGDGMQMREEYAMWVKYGKSSPTLTYSDGDQTTGPAVAAPLLPPVGIPAVYSDFDHNGVLSDDEKDVDGDGIPNWDEAHGRMLQTWWDSTFSGGDVSHPKETGYPLKYSGTDYLDPDTDGDGVLDGADDQDHDGFSNAFELQRPGDWLTSYISNSHAGTNLLARVQPFNPCKPYDTGYCERHPAFGYYADTEDWYTSAP